jgi:hypothetical protein
MTKDDVIREILGKLESRISVLKSALAETTENASGEETRSEGKYDTRAIEASYLAEAQREQLALAEDSLARFKGFEFPAFDFDAEISPGALVEVEQSGEICFYLLAPTGGGLMTEYLGCEVTVVSPDSRLFDDLLGRKLGETIELPPLSITGVE